MFCMVIFVNRNKENILRDVLFWFDIVKETIVTVLPSSDSSFSATATISYTDFTLAKLN